jgi:hypothetical protein
MILLSYILLVPFTYVICNWIFVLCAIIGGNKINLPEGIKFLIPFVLPLTLWCLHTILTQ